MTPLLAAAEARHAAGAQRFPGIRTEAAAVGMAALVGSKDAIAHQEQTISERLAC